MQAKAIIRVAQTQEKLTLENIVVIVIKIVVATVIPIANKTTLGS